MNNKIALGTAQFGLDYGISNTLGKTSEKEVSKILDLAIQKGISLIDTAQAYGSSEEIIGNHHRNRFNIITKLNSHLLLKYSANQLINESLKKLKLKSIYGVLFHSLSILSIDLQAYRDLVSLKNENVIEKIGFSANTLFELETFINEFGNPDILQIPYNIVDKRFEKSIISLHKEGVEIHSRSTFLQGLFFMKTAKLSCHFEKIKPFVEMLQSHYKKKEVLANFLLTNVLEKSFIDKVIIGVNNSEQLISNLNYIKDTNTSLSKNVIPKLNDNILNPSLWPEN